MRAMAAELGLLVTGGSDFHADPASPLRVGGGDAAAAAVGAAAGARADRYRES